MVVTVTSRCTQMRLLPGKFYSHIRMRDCCILLRKVLFENATTAKLKVSWYLRKGLRPMRLTERVTMFKQDENNWIEVEHDHT